jgi:hypothetical protein
MEAAKAVGIERIARMDGQVGADASVVRVRIAGIQSSSTIGLASALHNWLKNARKQEMGS